MVLLVEYHGLVLLGTTAELFARTLRVALHQHLIGLAYAAQIPLPWLGSNDALPIWGKLCKNAPLLLESEMMF